MPRLTGLRQNRRLVGDRIDGHGGLRQLTTRFYLAAAVLFLGLLQNVFRASVCAVRARAASTSADIQEVTLVTTRAIRVRVGDHGLNGTAAAINRLG